jgi:nitrate/TMAO reductase-like tetraheme cytochrome c subunit
MRAWGLRSLQVVLIFVPVGVAAAFLAMQTSSQPAFCGTCHIMKPYYESWKTSTHNDVPCVECHIPPGITAELQKKYEALSMVVKYFTGTYGTNPWAEISDEACLRPGCHEQRLLVGREVFKNVLFDHRPHLLEMRREKKLRCTSCHSQIVQGQHIAVTESTCFLCHFKDTKLNEGTARCTLCHEVPEKLITTAGLSFDHADVKRLGMECTLCHNNVVKGDGDVPQERCYICHNDPARLARLGDVELLHRTHVTEHKVDCLNCHLEIQHKVPKELEIVATECQTCHVGGGHSPQRDLYVGIGGKGVPPQPAAMYLAGVRCESCHMTSPPAPPRHGEGSSPFPLREGDQGVRLASDVSCMSCHGAKFSRIYEDWQTTLAERLQKTKGLLAHVQPLIAALEGAVPPAAQQSLQRAQENILFVERARPVHNPGYASALLRQAFQDLQQALRAANIEKTLPAPWAEAPYQTKCTACHLGAATLSKETPSGPFRHESHVARRGLECTRCHQEANYRESHHGAPKLQCTDCHPAAERMAQLQPQECLQCHQAQIPTRSKLVKFPHDQHISMGISCALCHQGVTQQSHLDFLRSGQGVPQLGHEFCALCHQSDVPPQGGDCLKCHTDF